MIHTTKFCSWKQLPAPPCFYCPYLKLVPLIIHQPLSPLQAIYICYSKCPGCLLLNSSMDQSHSFVTHGWELPSSPCLHQVEDHIPSTPQTILLRSVTVGPLHQAWELTHFLYYPPATLQLIHSLLEGLELCLLVVDSRICHPVSSPSPFLL